MSSRKTWRLLRKRSSSAELPTSVRRAERMAYACLRRTLRTDCSHKRLNCSSSDRIELICNQAATSLKSARAAAAAFERRSKSRSALRFAGVEAHPRAECVETRPRTSGGMSRLIVWP
eukprot:scaffold25495_cov30-Tisochrysis_lutea.AAC.3